MPDNHASPTGNGFKTTCPKCHKKLTFRKVSSRFFDKTFDCPSCRANLGVAVILKEDKADPKGQESRSVNTWAATGDLQEPQMRTKRRPESKEHVPEVQEAIDHDADETADDHQAPDAVYYDPQSKPAKNSRQPSRPLLSLRATRRLILFSIWWGPFWFFVFAGAFGPRSVSGECIVLGALSFFWGIFSSFFVWRLSRFITSLFVSRFSCPGCQELIECTAVWNTGQYKDHKQRHILLARDPFTGAWIGHTNCPFCDVTIFV